MRKWLIAVFLLALLETSCSHHVNIDYPGPGADPIDRCYAYWRLQPKSFARITTYSSNGGVNHEDSILMGDGTRVSELEDLLPLVSADSDYARGLRAADSHSRRSIWYGVSGIVAPIAGVTMLVKDAPTFVGGAFIASALPLFIISGVMKYYAADDRKRAAYALDKSMREHVGIDLDAQSQRCAEM